MRWNPRTLFGMTTSHHWSEVDAMSIGLPELVILLFVFLVVGAFVVLVRKLWKNR